MHALPGDKDAEIAELRVVVRDIVRELRETIYQLRANVSEDEDIVMVAGGYLERFAERTGITTALAARRPRRRCPTGSNRSSGGSGRRRS